jgi:hypothetical protein
LSCNWFESFYVSAPDYVQSPASAGLPGESRDGSKRDVLPKFVSIIAEGSKDNGYAHTTRAAAVDRGIDVESGAQALTSSPTC